MLLLRTLCSYESARCPTDTKHPYASFLARNTHYIPLLLPPNFPHGTRSPQPLHPDTGCTPPPGLFCPPILPLPPALPENLGGTLTSPVHLSLTVGESQVDMPSWKGNLEIPIKIGQAYTLRPNNSTSGICYIFTVHGSHKGSKKFYKDIH